MKKSLFLAACISAVLLFAGCSSPKDSTEEDPVLDFPTTEKLHKWNIKSWIDTTDSDNSIFINIGESYRLYNGSYSIDDAELSCSDRSVIEIYNEGIISSKKTGHVSLTLKSKRQNIDITLSAFVIATKISSNDSYAEITVEIPEGVGSIRFNRKATYNTNDSDYQRIGSIDRYSNRNHIEAGTYKFIDYFADSKWYDYAITGFSSKGSGNRFFTREEKLAGGEYGELNLNKIRTSLSFDGKKLNLTSYELPEHPENMKSLFYLNLLKDNNPNDMYTYSWEGSMTELDLYNCTNKFGEYIFRGKSFTVKEITMEFYDNTKPEGSYSWYPTYPKNTLDLAGITQFTVDN